MNTLQNNSTPLALQIPEIICQILSWIIEDKTMNNTYKQIYQCLFVNSLWHDCTSRYLWKHIVFEDSKSEYESFKKFTSTITQSNVKYYKAIRSIQLRKIKEKSLNGLLQQVAPCINRLEKLDFYICDHLSDISLDLFVKNNVYSTLTYISLAGCNKITDSFIMSVAHHCPRLSHLDLRACGQISDASISVIAEKCRNLHHLNVGRVRDRDRISIQSISLIAKYTKVAVLGLAGCDMTDECLVMLAKHRGKKLERISVNNCYKLTNKTIQAFVKYCPNLSVFEMKECHWIDDWSCVAELVQRRVLLTLCDQQNKACVEWARRHGRVMNVKAPIK